LHTLVTKCSPVAEITIKDHSVPSAMTCMWQQGVS